MNDLEGLARLIRYYSLVSTTEAGSGHPTSSLSAADLMSGLMFGGTFRYDLDDPAHPNNDRLIFSKGHASPLFYSLWAAAGKVSEKELLTLRKFGSPLEGHPTRAFRYTEAATGSLGQGLSIGVGMALNAKYLDKLPYRTYVLMGDSEMAEGSVWEAMELAAWYKLNNLVGIVFNHIDLIVNCTGEARGIRVWGSDAIMYNCDFTITSSDSSSSGVWFYNNSATTRNAVMTCFNVGGTTAGGGALTYSGPFVAENVNDANTLTLNLQSSVCTALAGTPIDAAVAAFSATTQRRDY